MNLRVRKDRRLQPRSHLTVCPPGVGGNVTYATHCFRCKRKSIDLNQAGYCPACWPDKGMVNEEL